ncbi:MAG: toll/interleukin-1 receptor domain-containing protein [Erythrobacter sp.]|nr:MAG: toll/interleukin-1 receptor domain-containing protein [Erythrobacter sp.]
MRAFISYSHRDAEALDRLHTHLKPLVREGQIETWFDRDILAGDELDADITEQLETCELVLLIVSPDFLASDYCVEREMQRALQRHDASEARVVPIIIEPCDWTSSPLRKLKAVPKDGKPVSEWTNENNAYLDVVQELRRILEAGVMPKAQTAPHVPEAVSIEQPQARRYRVQRDFDEIDRSDFRERAFQMIRDYFQRATAEIDSIEDLRGRFTPLSDTSFTCTIVNRARDRGVAHITVHRCSTRYGFGDITYSFEENAPDNTSNGGFSIEADEYELFLTERSFGYGEQDARLSPEDAAENLWTIFLQNAGVTYD